MDELEALGRADAMRGTLESALQALAVLGVSPEHVLALKQAKTAKRRHRLIMRLGSDYIDPPIYWLAVELLDHYGLPSPFGPGPQ